MTTEMIYTPKSEIEARIQRFQKTLQDQELDGALIVHHTNLFYLSGTSQSAHLFVPAAGTPILMVRKSFSRARRESPLTEVVELKSLKVIPEFLQTKGLRLERVGMELDIIPYNTWKFYNRVFQDSNLEDISDPLKRIRMIKSPYEIGLLERACATLDEVFADVPNMIREGMPEIELASLFEAGMRRRGYAGCSKMRAFNQDFFLGNVNTGTSGAEPSYFDGPVGGAGLTPANNPHGAGWKPIGRNEVIYIDYTCVINGYTADGARMFVLGEVSPALAEAHAQSLNIQASLVKILTPGVTCEAVYQQAEQLATEAGLQNHFMGMGKDRVRFVGHGVGLELDEYPIFASGLRMPLEAGMTFALEPKFIFAEGAIGTENTYVLEAGGARCLTCTPESITCL